MATDVNTPAADPSAATTTATQSTDFASYEREANESDMGRTGKAARTPELEDSATSDAPKVEKPDAQAKAEAVAESGTAQPSTQDGKGKKDAEGRIAELVAERNAASARAEKAERERDEAKTSGKKPEAEKTEAKPEAKAETKAEEYTPLDETKYYEEHPDATMNDWIAAQVAHRASFEVKQALKADKEATAKAAQEAAKAKSDAEWQSNWNTVKDEVAKENADFAEVVAKPLQIEKEGTMDIFIGQSKIGPRVYFALAKDPAKLEEISKLAPMYQAHALVELEKSLLPKAVEEKPVAAPAKPVAQRALKPPSTVSGRNSAPKDEAEAASASGDFSRYEAEENRRDLGR